VVKLIKYISRCNWKFIVLTQHPEHTVVLEKKLSTHMLEEIPPGTVIVQVPAPISLISKIFSHIMPESSLWWGWRVFWQGIKQCRTQSVDLIYITTPPFTPALIGVLLSKFTRKPLILDMKDDWVGSPIYQQKRAWRKLLDRLCESWLIRAAAQVILVTEHSYSMYRERYTNLCNPGKFHLVPNGSDLEEYLAYKPIKDSKQDGMFMILSAAWGYRKEYRDLTPFLLALNQFLRQYPQARQHLRIVLLGSGLSIEYSNLIQYINAQSIIEDIDSVDRTQLIAYLAQADLLFLVQPVNNTTAISGTLYEYWAMGKAPILLIAEEGASSKLVNENHLGKSFHFSDINGITSYLVEVFLAHQNQKPITINTNGIEKFDRRTLALQMAEIWHSCLPNSTKAK
jgi:glycosyltransferase involved in cell wall biosynthesis